MREKKRFRSGTTFGGVWSSTLVSVGVRVGERVGEKDQGNLCHWQRKPSQARPTKGKPGLLGCACSEKAKKGAQCLRNARPIWTIHHPSLTGISAAVQCSECSALWCAAVTGPVCLVKSWLQCNPILWISVFCRSPSLHWCRAQQNN